MKTIIKSFFSIAVLILTLNHSVNAQTPVYDVVSIGPGYANQVFYSMPNGEVAIESNTNWDLAFQISGFQASILVNSKNNVRLFKSGLDINAWSTVTPADTIGKLNTGNELFNKETRWWSGAFNVTADTTNQFDLGWGVYDFATHAVTGDSLYFIRLANGAIKKLWIQQLQNSIYYFAFADVDGSNEINTSLSKLNYAGKNFGYYSIQNNSALNREPNKYAWDLTFMQYLTTSPFTYKVTGVLANDSVSTVKVYPVDPASASPWGAPFSYNINNIGFDWKTFDMNINQWTLSDSTVYYVYGRAGGLWKLVFSGFGGAATGDFEFYKEQVSATGLNENDGKPLLLNVYPVPAGDYVNLAIYIHDAGAENHVMVHDFTGRLVYQRSLKGESGLLEKTIPTESLPNGFYMVSVNTQGAAQSQRIIIAR